MREDVEDGVAGRVASFPETIRPAVPYVRGAETGNGAVCPFFLRLVP
jgi:hypothetical protein